MNNIAEKIIENLGGAENINSLTHCATRLRFDIKDRGKIRETELKNAREILGVVDKGGQYQLVIGTAVEQMYNKIVPLLKGGAEEKLSVETAEKSDTDEKKSYFNMALDYISGAISPTLPVLIGAGMINAVLAIAVLLGLSKESGTYMALSSMANIGFSYLPVFVAYAAARKLRTNEYLAAFLSLAMIVCFNQQDGMSLYGLAIPNIKYANCIVPILMVAPVQLAVDRFCDKVIPKAAHFVVKSLVIILVVSPILIFIMGPVGAWIGTVLANSCIWLMEVVGPLALAVLSALHSITVMFGMHYLFTPIMTNEVAATGYSFVLCRALAANFAMAGAAVAVGIKAKKMENKSVGFSSGITALLGISEPALYGCLIRLKKPLITSSVAAGITGAFLGLFQVKAYAIASPGILSLPIFIGGESMSNFVLACVGAALGFGLGFILTWIAGFKEN